MYVCVVILLTGLLPLASIVVSARLHPHAGVLLLTGTWFSFWAVGIRLVAAGLRQAIQPAFTARKIFELEGEAPLALVRELGFSNFAIGLVGVISLFHAAWIMPAAVSGGAFYGLAGMKHLASKRRTRLQDVAMVSDLFVFAVLAAYVAGTLARRA